MRLYTSSFESLIFAPFNGGKDMYTAEYFSPLYKECTVGNWETCQDSRYYNEKNDSYQTIFASRKEAENVARTWAKKYGEKTRVRKIQATK